MEKAKKRERDKKKLVLIGLGALAAGVAGYFGWQWWKKKKLEFKEVASDEILPIPMETKKSAGPASFSPILRNDEFPLKKGSKGERVKKLQEFMIIKYGRSLLPKYGADG